MLLESLPLNLHGDDDSSEIDLARSCKLQKKENSFESIINGVTRFFILNKHEYFLTYKGIVLFKLIEIQNLSLILNRVQGIG